MQTLTLTGDLAPIIAGVFLLLLLVVPFLVFRKKPKYKIPKYRLVKYINMMGEESWAIEYRQFGEYRQIYSHPHKSKVDEVFERIKEHKTHYGINTTEKEIF